MNSRCANCNHEDCQCDRPPMPAAGPWRYDVENAPKDGSEILLAWETSRPFIDLMHWDSSIEKWNDDSDNPLEAGRVFAFVTINPPETPHA